MEKLIEFLKVIADPTRMKIVKFLMEEDLCVCELVKIMGVAQPTVSQHLRRLKAIGLAVERREGQRINYSLVKPVFRKYMNDLNTFLAASPQGIPEMKPEYQRYIEAVAGGKMDCSTGEEC